MTETMIEKIHRSWISAYFSMHSCRRYYNFSAKATSVLDCLQEGKHIVPLKRSLSENNFISPKSVLKGERIEEKLFYFQYEKRLRGVIYFGLQTEGYPGKVHGGASATIADNALGTVAWLSGLPCVTGTFTMRYRNMIPLETECYIETSIDRVDGKKIICSGRLTSLSRETVYSEFDGIFIRIVPEPGVAHPPS